MKQNAKADKPFTLNAHLRGEVGGAGGVLTIRLTHIN